MSTNQCKRLAVEAPEERKLRLEHYSTSREQQLVQSLFQQCSIQTKMQKFHVNMATLDQELMSPMKQCEGASNYHTSIHGPILH